LTVDNRTILGLRCDTGVTGGRKEGRSSPVAKARRAGAPEEPGAGAQAVGLARARRKGSGISSFALAVRRPRHFDRE